MWEICKHVIEHVCQHISVHVCEPASVHASTVDLSMSLTLALKQEVSEAMRAVAFVSQAITLLKSFENVT